MQSIRRWAWRSGASGRSWSRRSVPDYPVAPLQARIELSGPPRLNRTLRDWGLYEEDGSRQFVFRSTTRNWDEFSPAAGDIVPGVPAAHLAPLPWHRHVELVAALRAAGTEIVSVDLDDRRLAEVARDDVIGLMASVDHVSSEPPGRPGDRAEREFGGYGSTLARHCRRKRR